MIEFSLILVLLNFLIAENYEEPTISINSTTFVGCSLKTWKGSYFWGFRGIRFAQPPVGELRFKVNFVNFFFFAN